MKQGQHPIACEAVVPVECAAARRQYGGEPVFARLFVAGSANPTNQRPRCPAVFHGAGQHPSGANPSHTATGHSRLDIDSIAANIFAGGDDPKAAAAKGKSEKINLILEAADSKATRSLILEHLQSGQKLFVGSPTPHADALRKSLRDLRKDGNLFIVDCTLAERPSIDRVLNTIRDDNFLIRSAVVLVDDEVQSGPKENDRAAALQEGLRTFERTIFAQELIAQAPEGGVLEITTAEPRSIQADPRYSVFTWLKVQYAERKRQITLAQFVPPIVLGLLAAMPVVLPLGL